MAKCKRVWFIDDDGDEHRLRGEILKQVAQGAEITFFQQAETAVETLRTTGKKASPNLILCDVRMPTMTGFQFLEWLRSSRHKAIPVVMFSNSGAQADVNRAYVLGANAYHVKPADIEETRRQFASLSDYWIDYCKVPEDGYPGWAV